MKTLPRRIHLVWLAAGLALAGCGAQPAGGPMVQGIGDPARGSVIVGRQACGSCHTIEGRQDAYGLAAPPLTGFGSRTVIAGLLPNTPANLVAWLRAPQRNVPGNAMPDLGLTERQARDVAAYLYTLR